MIKAGKVEYWAGLGNESKVREAVEQGHDVNLRGHGGYTPLHAAAENGFVEIIRMLVDAGALIRAQVETGETPADLALIAGKLDAFHLLNEHDRA